MESVRDGDGGGEETANVEVNATTAKMELRCNKPRVTVHRRNNKSQGLIHLGEGRYNGMLVIADLTKKQIVLSHTKM